MVMQQADRDHLNRKIVTITHAALMRKTIKLTCPTCKRERLLDAVTLWWLYLKRGWDDRLPKAIRHFYCHPCWHLRCHAARPFFEIIDKTPEGEQFPYPPESEWKRLVSRYRS